jgi:putative acetyltransferase
VAAEAPVSIAVEDPRAREAAGLIADLVGFLTALYPEDDEEGPPPWTVDDLAREKTFLVARIGGEAAGCGGLATLPWPDAMEIVRMYVQPHRRGRRLAERVLAELEALARERGAGVLMLRCGPRQPQALRVYERNGYVRRAAFAHHREHPTNLFYEKRLVA